MVAVNHKKLRRLFEAAEKDRTPNRFFNDIGSALTAGELKPEEFSVRQLFEEFVPDGSELVRTFDPRNGAGGVNLLEAAGAVDTSAFSNITGQIVYAALMEKYMAEEFTFSKLVRTVPTQFNGEKIAGIGELGDKAQIVPENGLYPTYGVNEDWIETPQTTKRGMIVPVTKEAIFFDRTGLILQRAGDVGNSMGINKEKRVIDCVIDENSTGHRYKWRGTTYATYQASTPWVNIKGSNALVDWTDIDAAEQTFSGMVDPNTGEPILITPKQLICTRDLLYTARRVINATEITVTTPGYATSDNPSQAKLANPVMNYQLVTSLLLKSRMATDTTWFIGDIQKAFAYMENWPITVVQAASNSEAEFTQDVVSRFKVSERGAMATMEPRAMVQCTVGA